MLSVFVEYSIDAAHFLPNVPEGHKCGRMHGHRYDIRLEVSGCQQESTGWIIDYALIKAIVDPIIMGLDHQTLNEIEGLENPTCEEIVYWIKSKVRGHLPGLTMLEVRETDRSGCVWRDLD
jgi:6-pyruvoyltetrahydropterin/6-carboxytetrahydropterin synthase